ncbi:MAG: hypothetical protein H6600_09390 [Flavobacteriales bacterium]|nr:hypothetical protein [Flavobacteriales bacterium]
MFNSFVPIRAGLKHETKETNQGKSQDGLLNRYVTLVWSNLSRGVVDSYIGFPHQIELSMVFQ